MKTRSSWPSWIDLIVEVVVVPLDVVPEEVVLLLADEYRVRAALLVLI